MSPIGLVFATASVCLSFTFINSADLTKDGTFDVDAFSNVSCVTCAGRCGEVQVMKKSSCSCDSLCEQYGDCCPDFLKYCSNSLPKVQHTKNTVKDIVKCMDVHRKKMLLVAECPYSENACVQSDDVIASIPVTDRDTGIHYIHAICASCNGVQNIVPWRSNLKTRSKSRKDMQSILDWEHHYGVTPEEGQPTIRWCLEDKKLVRTCSADFQNLEIKEKCTSGFRQYVNVKRTIYYNIFCALCNHVNIFEFECFVYLNGGISRDAGGYMYSLRLYFSTNLGGGTLALLSKDCPENHIYFASDEKCRPFWRSKTKEFVKLKVDISLPKTQGLPTSVLEKANKLVEYLEYNFQSKFNISIGVCTRSWQRRIDTISLFLTKSNDVNDLTATAANASALLANFNEHVRNVESQISKAQDANCKFTGYAESDVLFDINGDATLPHGEKVNAGRYTVGNGTVAVCYRPSVSDAIIGWLTIVSMAISVLCIIAHLTMNYVHRPKKCWRTSGLATCLLVTNLTFLVSPQLSSHLAACYTAGALLHWGFLASFTWMNYIAVDIWLALAASTTLNQGSVGRPCRSWKFSLPFLPPTLIIIGCVIVDKWTTLNDWRPKYGEGSLCWMMGRNVLQYVFILPGAVSVTLTVIFTALCAYRLFSLWKMTKNTAAKQRNYFMMFVKLAAMTGIAWCFGFVAIPTGDATLFAIFVLLVATQGVWILLVIWGNRCTRLFRHLTRKDSGSTKNTTTPAETPLTSA